MNGRRGSARGRVTALVLLAFAIGVIFGALFSVLSENGNSRPPSGFRSVPQLSSLEVFGLAALVLVLVVLALRAGVTRSLRALLDPLAAMTATVRQLGPQNIAHRVGHSGDVEVRALAEAVDGMLDRVAASFDGQRRFASNASHELRTPLAVQRTMIEVALVTSQPDADLRRLGAELLLVNERNEQLIEGLLVLAESDRGLPGTVPVRLDELVGSVLDVHVELAARHQVRLERTLAERTIPGDPVLLERMVVNLVHNAIKYNHPGGVVEVTLADELTVCNTGQRVPAEVVPSLFEPFRRLTSERTHQRDGAGLGLSIVRSIAAAHQGRVTATPGESGGLCVRITLPT